jgi:hypothetical protein
MNHWVWSVHLFSFDARTRRFAAPRRILCASVTLWQTLFVIFVSS